MREVAGFHVRLGDKLDPAVNSRVHALARALEGARLPGVTEVIPSYATVFIEYEPLRLNEKSVRNWAAGVTVDTSATAGKAVSVSVRYDGQDLHDVAAAVGLDVAEVVRRHSSVEYRVYAIGFTPGFPFMGAVDPVIRMPRLPS
ncbi:MAG TPA: carboxyltransferase domain-containing protein, partial [Trueperaceae bacterium]|nr:carboxyltransferase domain-containing protein [Trueperaceae bacterium]